MQGPKEDYRLPAVVPEEGDAEPEESAGAPLGDLLSGSEAFDAFDAPEALVEVPELPEVSDEPDDPEEPDEPEVDGDLAGVDGAADDSVALGGGVVAAEESLAPGAELLPEAAGAFDEPEDCGVEGVAWLEDGVALLEVADSSRCLQANRAGKTRRAKTRRFMMGLLSMARHARRNMHIPRLIQAG